MHHQLAFIGFGNVARALARLLLRKQVLLKTRYDITFSVTGIATGQRLRSTAQNEPGEALSLVEAEFDFRTLHEAAEDSSPSFAIAGGCDV
jgi:homoserine dehydrogenase